MTAHQIACFTTLGILLLSPPFQLVDELVHVEVHEVGASFLNGPEFGVSICAGKRMALLKGLEVVVSSHLEIMVPGNELKRFNVLFQFDQKARGNGRVDIPEDAVDLR